MTGQDNAITSLAYTAAGLVKDQNQTTLGLDSQFSYDVAGNLVSEQTDSDGNRDLREHLERGAERQWAGLHQELPQHARRAVPDAGGGAGHVGGERELTGAGRAAQPTKLFDSGAGNLL